MKFDLYDNTGAKKGDVTASAELFGAKINPDLMHRAVVLRLANRRLNVAHVQTRGEVNATTAKAFRQKGTGRARRGAKTTTLLRGGGASHGPRNVQNFSKAMPQKERRAALFSSLTVKANEKSIFALEELGLKDPKTKTLVTLLDKLPKAKKYLFVVPERDDALRKSVSNIPNVKIILASYLNPLDTLWAEKICFVAGALQKTEETFLTTAKK